MSSATASLTFDAQGRPIHAPAFRLRRFLNWFPMGLTYAFLYWGRYNLTVAKNALGVLMTKEDFGIIVLVGSWVYALAFLLNGPLTDRMGGKKAILAAALGSFAMNLAMGGFVQQMLTADDPSGVNLRLWMSVLYGVNMYFQSFAAVAIVKVNAQWFHLRERGGFSGIFGTMISSGIFFAYTITGLIVDTVVRGAAPGERPAVWWAFFAPAIALGCMFIVELIFLKDRPADAGHADFDTGDASSFDNGEQAGVGVVLKRIVTNPVLLTIGAIEFCTGVLRNGVMYWFPIYAKEVWSLPSKHALLTGDWTFLQVAGGMAFVVAGLAIAGRGGNHRGFGLGVAVLGLIPFVPAGWGGFLFAAGVLGGNAAGWVSDLLFQSRRAPAAGSLYAVLAVCALLMSFALGGSTTEVSWVKQKDGPLQPGDVVTSVAGVGDLKSWRDVNRAFACVQSACSAGAQWDTARCMCSETPKATTNPTPMTTGTIAMTVMRAGQQLELQIPDPAKVQRAGDKRTLAAGPVLTLSPIWLALLVFILSFAVIGTHGLLSGTASMDFGGRKAAATAAGMIDGFVYLGTGLQSVALGYLTTRDWSLWPLFLIPFALVGFILCTRIWHVRPGKGHAAH